MRRIVGLLGFVVLGCGARSELPDLGPFFAPVDEYAWGGEVTAPYASDVMMAPIVVPLRGETTIVVSTFPNGVYTGEGIVHALAVADGKLVERWRASGILAGQQLAAGDIDGEIGNEIVGCGIDGRVHALRDDRTLRWKSAPLACLVPQIGDLDGDGRPEVVVEGGILDGATGVTKATFNPPIDASFVLGDLDGDGRLDVVTAARAYHLDGTLFVDTGLSEVPPPEAVDKYVAAWGAMADFDLDGKPDVVHVNNASHTIALWTYDPSRPGGYRMLREPIDYFDNPFVANHCSDGTWGLTHGGGPPTIADFDGDGVPDVGVAVGFGYLVFDGKKLVDPDRPAADTFLWGVPTVDCSSASTGSSVFDFDGDGRAEVVYSDQQRLRIYDGRTGHVLFSTCNTTATLAEYPVIADVDGDGHADIVVVSNAYGQADPSLRCGDEPNVAQSGVRVFGDAFRRWMGARSIWNEHAYHVTNVADDGSIPHHELPNWTQPGLDDFRQNR